MRLIVALGNPGAKYTHTRHNIGFMVGDQVLKTYGGQLRKAVGVEGQAATISIDQTPCLLLHPTTYMNNSGVAVKAYSAKKCIDPKEYLVIADDLSLPFGQLRFRPSGSAGGHNGLKSIIEHLGTNQFARLRIGISRPPLGVNTADYVLSDFTTSERKALTGIINTACDSVACWATSGVEAAMNTYNKQKDKQ